MPPGATPTPAYSSIDDPFSVGVVIGGANEA